MTEPKVKYISKEKHTEEIYKNGCVLRASDDGTHIGYFDKNGIEYIELDKNYNGNNK